MIRKFNGYIFLSHDFLIGMPQLALGGLSENWLLKECGNQHWLALAKHLGLTAPYFIDSKGQPMYAAFLVAKIKEARLNHVVEHARLSIETTLKRVSPSRSYSCHKIYANGGEGRENNKQVIATLELLSSFVSRSQQGNNQTVARAEIAKGNWAACERASTMMHEHKYGRSFYKRNICQKKYKKEFFTYHPCPYSDFNGADFLYFAQFQSIVDRAERHLQADAQLWTSYDRSIYYYGNINLDDSLHCYIDQENPPRLLSKRALKHQAALYRQSDQALIAAVVTHKKELIHQHQQWSEKLPTENTKRSSMQHDRIKFKMGATL